MTVSNQKRSIRYQGNDSATEFNYDFFIEEATHVEVIIYNSTTETYTTLTGGQYSITGLNDPGFGAVTYPLAGDPLSTDEYIIINRVAPYVQVMDILPQGGFHPDVVEAAMDRTTRQIQQIAEIQSRSLFIVEGEGFQKRLPLRSLLVDRVLAFDENGDPTLGPTATNVDNAQGYANAAEAARDAAQTAQGAAETAQGNAETAQSAAETAQGAAETAQGAAETAQGAAETAQSLAQQWANEDEDVVVTGGEYSAKHYSLKASAAAEDAAAITSAATRLAFDSSTTDADPGAGEFRLNNADPTSVTEIYVDDVDVAGTDITGVVGAWGEANNDVRGTLTLRCVTDPAKMRQYNITAAVTNASGYKKLTVAYVGGAGAFVAAEEWHFLFNRAGNQGSGTSDVTGPSSSLDNSLVAFDGTTGKVIQDSAIGLSEIKRDTPTPPTFAYRFKEGQPLPVGLTNGRSTSGSRRRRDALLASEAANVLRHQYKANGEYLGVMIEDASENLGTYSNDLNNPAWTKTNCTITSDATSSPIGMIDKIVTNADTNTTHYVGRSYSVTSGEEVCWSVMAKQAEYAWLYLYMSSAPFGATVSASFDLANGEVSGTGAGVTATIEDMGGGVYRCSVGKAATATASTTVRAYVAEANNDVTFDGDGSSGIYVGGTQFEKTRVTPSNYIPTSSSTATRAEDELRADLTDIGFNEVEGAFYWCGTIDGAGHNHGLLLAYETSSAGISISYDAGNFRVRKRDGGSSDLAGISYTPVKGEIIRIVGYWTAALVGISVNGSAAVEVAGTEAPSPTEFRIGDGHAGAASAHHDGTLIEWAVYDRALSAAEAAIMSARGLAIGETLYAPEVMKRVGLPISRLLGSGDGVAANLQAVFDGAPNGSTFIFEDTVDWGSARPSSPYITLPRHVRLEWKQPWDLTGFASTTGSPVILQRGGSLTGSAIDLNGTPSLTKGSTDRVTVAAGQGVNFAVGERWLLHATASLTTLTGAFSLLEAADSPYWNRRCESVWIERVEGDVVYFTKPINDDYPNSCDPRLIKYDDDIDIELINPMIDAFTPYVDSDEGNWATSTAYSVGDHVIYANRGYVCISAHTSDSTNFSTDYDASRWLDMGSDRFIDVTLARRLHIIGGRARRLSGMFARISGVADLKIDGLRGDMNDKGSTAPGGFLYVGGDTDGARFRDLDVTGGGQPFMQSSTAAHYGIFRNSVWENCISRGSLNGAFSQHNLEEGTTYRGCKVFDCDGHAFDVRTRDVTIDGPVVRRSGTGVYHRLVATGFRLRNFDFRECLAGYRLTTFSGAHEVTPGDITIENGTMIDIGGVGSTGGISAVYGYDVSLGKLMVTNVAIEMNNATAAIEIAGRWNRPELRSVSLIGTSGTGRAVYMHDESLGAGKGPYAPALNGINHETNYAAPLISNYGGYPSLRDIKKLNATTEVMTLASDALTTLLIYESIAVAAESGTTDTLSTLPIMALETRRVLFADTGDTITVSVTLGNIRRADGGTGDITLTDARMIMVEARGSLWYIL